jgi:uncharacterized membrane protein HdeD (DUF308 family)
MATPLDTGLLNFLLPVFIFVLIYAILFGVLKKSEIFGDNNSTNAIIAAVVALLFAITPGAMDFVSIIAPWFMVMLIIIFVFMLLFMFMGVKLETFTQIASSEASIRWTIIIIGIIVIIIGLTSVFGPIFGTPAGDGGGIGNEIQRSIFDPRVLTTLFILLIVGQAVRLISEKD